MRSCIYQSQDFGRALEE